jgi:hypothetical protein
MVKTAEIIIIDECTAKIEGLDLVTRRSCVNAVKYFLPHARYSPAYKLGRWDGTQSFCTLGGRTYLNLLDKILPVIIDCGYEIEIQDHRAKHEFEFAEVDENYLSHISWPADHRMAGEPIVLRDYQIQAINECVNNLQGISIAPTSAGKTIITASLSRIAERYGRTIVIVPNKNLVQQTEEDYRNIGLDVGVLYGDRKEFDRTHTICTWQSLMVLDKKSKDALDDDQLAVFMDNLVAVICDECFDGSMRVLTPSGYVPIKDIKPGDQVINYSESQKIFKTDTVVKQHLNLTNSTTEKMFRLEFDDGSIIKVTGNHKFMTNKGWVRADELTSDHDIININTFR